MNTLDKLANALLEIFDLYIWYIIVGSIIAVWSLLFLAAVMAKKPTLIPLLFGLFIALCIICLGLVSIYNTSNGFAKPVKFSPFIVPLSLLVSDILVCLILTSHRKKYP